MQLFRISGQYEGKVSRSFKVTGGGAAPVAPAGPGRPVGEDDFHTTAQPVGVVEGAAPGDGVTIREFSKTVGERADPIVVVVCLGTFKLTPSSSYLLSEVGRATVAATVFTDSSN